MKITKSQLRQLIREEIQKESGAFGTYAAPISGTGGLSYSGSKTSGRPRPEPKTSSDLTALERAGIGKRMAAEAAWNQFLKDNPDIANDEEEINRIGMKLQNNPPAGGLSGYSERVKEMLYRWAGKSVPQ
jgi:hypothetical protein